MKLFYTKGRTTLDDARRMPLPVAGPMRIPIAVNASIRQILLAYTCLVLLLIVRPPAVAQDFQANLGEKYLGGQGIPRDYEAAANWLQKPAAQGNSAIQTNRCFVRRLLRP